MQHAPTAIGFQIQSATAYKIADNWRTKAITTTSWADYDYCRQMAMWCQIEAASYAFQARSHLTNDFVIDEISNY